MEELIRQINHFAGQAAIIEPDAARRNDLLNAVNAYVERFLEDLPERPAFIFTEDMGAGLYDSPIAEEGMEIGEILRIYKENVDDQGLSPVSGRFLGYIPPCSMYYSALGDYLAAVTNEYAGEFASCPGAVRMEYQLLDWMAQLVGYVPGEAKGVLASGGSIATLTCLVTAREAHGLKAGDYSRAVVYSTRFTHHCVAKALHLIGLGDCVRRELATDAQYRMDPDALAQALRADREAGLNPWLLVASAGTTDLGNVDELDRLGACAREHGLWFHVDGAYGGFFVLCDRVRARFRGIELSDSVVMNPHKGLHTPFGLGAALVRNGEHLYRAPLSHGRLPAGPDLSPAGDIPCGHKSGADPPFPRPAPVAAAQAHRRGAVPRHVERETVADEVCLPAPAIRTRYRGGSRTRTVHLRVPLRGRRGGRG